MQVEDEGEIQHLGTNKYIPLVSCISNLFKSWHFLLKSRSIVHGYLLSTYRCGIRILSAMIWSQGGAASPFWAGAVTIAGVVVWGFRSSSVPVNHDSCLVESRTPLWVGSSQANHSVFNTLSQHSPLVAVSRSMSIISLLLGSSASLSSPFSSSCYVGSHCSAFLAC